MNLRAHKVIKPAVGLLYSLFHNIQNIFDIYAHSFYNIYGSAESDVVARSGCQGGDRAIPGGCGGSSPGRRSSCSSSPCPDV